MTTKEMTVSIVGYKASKTEPNGYVSQVFTNIIAIDETTLLKIEQGTPIPIEYMPALEEGWFDSPEKATKKPLYDFTPDRSLSGIKVVK